jgi:hypothetical protein
MTTHVIADTTTAPTTLDATTDDAWLRLSAAITDEVPVIADREDLLVTIAPGAGHGAPACFMPAHATIEIDGLHLAGVDPASVAPDRIGDRARYSTAWGLLTHECAHAAHSVWNPPEGAPPRAVDAAMLLEESRIEAAQIRRRPDDRHWLRASATSLILTEIRTGDPDMTAPDAARTAALLLARTDAGILNPDETAPVAEQVDTVLGADTLAVLRDLWRTAHTVADDDAETMIDLGRRWCEALGTDPDLAPSEATSGDSDGSGDSGGSGTPSPLSKAIVETVGKVLSAVADESAPTDPATLASEGEDTERAADEGAKRAAKGVFARTAHTSGRTRIGRTRRPTSAERQAARTLARAVTTAGIRDRVTTKTTSPTPPGRLRMRGALAADAQRAAGALPTAEPFTRTTRRVAPAPPLRIGIACDVSGSMTAVTGPVASAAWILAHAAHHAQVPATTATVIFGNYVRPITQPGIAPTDVTEFVASDNAENIPRAIDALDGALDLARPGAARLLVIVSDGGFVNPSHRTDGQARVNRLRAAGCGVLWLTTSKRDTPLHGATVHQLADPTTTAKAIGRAATAALRATR